MPNKRGRPRKDEQEQETAPEILTSQQEVIDLLKMSRSQFQALLRKYPFYHSGAPGKISGRWHVTKDAVWEWFNFVQFQEMRHPDARRLRPAEPPVLKEIRGR